jgi:hypothetical protein
VETLNVFPDNIRGCMRLFEVSSAVCRSTSAYPHEMQCGVDVWAQHRNLGRQRLTARTAAKSLAQGCLVMLFTPPGSRLIIESLIITFFIISLLSMRISGYIRCHLSYCIYRYTQERSSSRDRTCQPNSSFKRCAAENCIMDDPCISTTFHIYR